MKTTCKGKATCLVLIYTLLITAPTVSAASGKSPAFRKNPSSRTLRSMARVYMAYGEYAKAQPLAEKALNLARTEGVSDSELAMCLIDLATLYTYQGKLSDAEEMCKSGLELQKKTLCKNHPYLAYTSRTLSSIYYEQGKYSKARSALDEAVAIVRDSPIANETDMAPFLVDMARILMAQGNLAQAENYYQKALLLINTTFGPSHLYTASVLADIAKLYVLKERYTEAEELIDQAITIQEKTYGSDHHLISASWLTKAKICQERGDFAQAEQLIKKSLSALEKSGNTAALEKFQKAARDIRIRQVAYKPQGRNI